MSCEHEQMIEIKEAISHEGKTCIQQGDAWRYCYIHNEML